MTNAASSLPSQFCSRRAPVPPTRGTEHCHKFRSAIPAVGLKSTSERQHGDSEQSHRSNCTTASNPLRRAPFSPGNNDISVEGVRQVNFHQHSIQTLKHMVTLFQHNVAYEAADLFSPVTRHNLLEPIHQHVLIGTYNKPVHHNTKHENTMAGPFLDHLVSTLKSTAFTIITLTMLILPPLATVFTIATLINYRC